MVIFNLFQFGGASRLSHSAFSHSRKCYNIKRRFPFAFRLRVASGTHMKHPLSKFSLSLGLAALLFACTPSTASDSLAQTKGQINIVGPWEESTAFEAVSAAFTKAYPNCQVHYEYLQNYYTSLKTRLNQSDAKVDLFVTQNIQSTSAQLPYAYDLLAEPSKLDLSNTFPGLLDNFRYIPTASDTDTSKRLYAIPLGSDLRGLYVNKTLLASLGINSVPTKRSSFLESCATISKAGKDLIPLQGNPGSFGHWLFYPYICNLIANATDYEKKYTAINTHQAGCSEYFREPLQLFYDLVSSNYYNYKYMEKTYGLFTDGETSSAARNFFNVVTTAGNYSLGEGPGRVAMMPGPMSIGNTMAKTKETYHSQTDYEFILSPLGENGGFAYVSPSIGIAINKNSNYRDWSLRYLNFLFTPVNNILYATKDHIAPNVSTVYAELQKQFQVPNERITELGKMTFDFDFYSRIVATLTEISKANNPDSRYMIDNGDGTWSMHPFSYFMDNLEKRLVAA